MLQYVWVEKEQTLIISPAQHGSGRASSFIRGSWLFVKPLMCLITSNIQEPTTSFILFFFFLLLLFSVTVTAKTGGRSVINIIPSTVQSIQVCCTSVEGEEAESWSGTAFVLTAKNKGPDNSPSLTTSKGLI